MEKETKLSLIEDKHFLRLMDEQSPIVDNYSTSVHPVETDDGKVLIGLKVSFDIYDEDKNVFKVTILSEDSTVYGFLPNLKSVKEIRVSTWKHMNDNNYSILYMKVDTGEEKGIVETLNLNYDFVSKTLGLL